MMQQTTIKTKKTLKMHKRLLRENLEYGDLKRLVHNELHIDEYKSKMGNDDEVCVVSFKVGGKQPSADLVAFVEKSYDYVLDADVSSGEKEDGDYLVFVEIPRTPELPEQIVRMIEDILNLTEQTQEEWRVKYHKSLEEHPLDAGALKSIIPLTPEEYASHYGSSEEDTDEEDITKDLDALKAAAGVKVDTVAPKNDYTESLRIAAGIL